MKQTDGRNCSKYASICVKHPSTIVNPSAICYHSPLVTVPYVL